MLLQMENINEFKEEVRHLESQYAILYLQELQRSYWENLQKEKMAQKLAAFKRKYQLN